MARAGDTLTNRSGEQIVFRRTTAETGGELLEVEVLYRPNATPPPAHYHPSQEERFEVLQGAIQTRIGGVTRTYLPGERFTVPPGVSHQMHSSGAEPGRMRWEIRPALNTEAFFETLWGLAQDGKTNANGVPNLLQLAVILQAHRPEFRLSSPPYPVQRVLWGILAPLGRLLGYSASYQPAAAPKG